MKIETKSGSLAVIAETDLEGSYLCLWEAEMTRILEHEGVSPNILERLLCIQPSLGEGEPQRGSSL